MHRLDEWLIRKKEHQPRGPSHLGPSDCCSDGRCDPFLPRRVVEPNDAVTEGRCDLVRVRSEHDRNRFDVGHEGGTDGAPNEWFASMHEELLGAAESARFAGREHGSHGLHEALGLLASPTHAIAVSARSWPAAS